MIGVRAAARATIMQTNVDDAYLGRVFGSLGTSSSLLMFVGTLTAGAVGGILGPIALLNFQGGAYVVAGVFVLLMLAPSRAPRRDPASAVAGVFALLMLAPSRAPRRDPASATKT